MNTLYRILDVAYGFHIAKQGMSRTYGGSARTLFGLYAALSLLLAALLWRYDIASTWAWGLPWATSIAESLPEWASFGPYTINMVSTLIGFSTIIIQFGFPRLAQFEAARWGFAIAATFDLVTDAPTVIKDVDAHLIPLLQSQFGLAGPLLWLARYASYGTLTIAASFVVQSLLFVLIASCVYLWPRMWMDRLELQSSMA